MVDKSPTCYTCLRVFRHGDPEFKLISCEVIMPEVQREDSCSCNQYILYEAYEAVHGVSYAGFPNLEDAIHHGVLPKEATLKAKMLGWL